MAAESSKDFIFSFVSSKVSEDFLSFLSKCTNKIAITQIDNIYYRDEKTIYFSVDIFCELTNKHINVILDGLGPQADWHVEGLRETISDENFILSVSFVAI